MMIISLLMLTLLCTTAIVNAHNLFDVNEMISKRNEVMSDSNPTKWLRYGYDGKQIVYDGSGANYNEFLQGLHNDNRAYGYVRFDIPIGSGGFATKFAFITWIGPGVSPLKKAKVSTDKAFVKQVLTDFNKEILADDKNELSEAKVSQVLEAASGAAYGTGK